MFVNGSSSLMVSEDDEREVEKKLFVSVGDKQTKTKLKLRD